MAAKYVVLSEYFVYNKREKYAGKTNAYPMYDVFFEVLTDDWDFCQELFWQRG